MKLLKLFLLPLRYPVKTFRHLSRGALRKFVYHIKHSHPAVVQARIERKLGVDQSLHQTFIPSGQKFCLMISGCPGDTFRYRCEHQAEQLAVYGLTADKAFVDQVDLNGALLAYQCFFLHRVPHTEGLEEFIHRAEQIGKVVIFDTDDLVFDKANMLQIRALEHMGADEIKTYADNIRQQHRTLASCRYAMVTSEPLRKAVEELFPKVHCFVNPNSLSDRQVALAEEALNLSRPLEDPVITRIAYFSGTRTHNIDFKECAAALRRILRVYPNVHLMLVGHIDVGKEFSEFEERVERFPLMPWQELPRLFRRVDINLAPLERGNPFTECKSNIKYLEAAVMGVPTVATDIEPFKGAIVHGENGYLCKSDNEWFQCLCALVKDTALREKVGSIARIDALKNWTTSAGAHKLLTALTEIAENQSPVLKNLLVNASCDKSHKAFSG